MHYFCNAAYRPDICGLSDPLSKGIELAFVFGSVAKWEDTAASDIDLMIISASLSRLIVGCSVLRDMMQ
ncbi:MAG: hypothetical protein ABR612_12345 [Chromatocurvus sp.]